MVFSGKRGKGEFLKGKRKKKGMSNIVAVVLTILITIVAIGIIWLFLIPFFSNIFGSHIPGARIDVVTIEGYTVYDPEEKFLLVQMKRGSDEEELYGVRILIDIKGDTYSFYTATPPSKGGKTLSGIDLEDYSISGTPEYVSVAPIYLEGSGVKSLGSVTSRAKVPIYSFDVSSYSYLVGKTVPDNDDDYEADTTHEEGAVCGNGLVETGEECDDSNTESSDGCDSICNIEWTEFSSCPGFDNSLNIEGGYYRVTNDLTTTETCFHITANGVTLDGQGHKITGDGVGNDFGIIAQGPKIDEEIKGISIKNFGMINNFYNGINLLFVNESLIEDVNVNESAMQGIYLSYSNNNLLRNLNVNWGTFDGVFISNSNGNFLSNVNAHNNDERGFFISSSNNTLLENINSSYNERGITFINSIDNNLSNSFICSNNVVSGCSSSDSDLTGDNNICQPTGDFCGIVCGSCP